MVEVITKGRDASLFIFLVECVFRRFLRIGYFPYEKKRNKIINQFILVVSTLLVVMVVGMQYAIAQEKTPDCIPIEEVPYTIKVPGKYCLTHSMDFEIGEESHIKYAITIFANNVKLDLMGNTLQGSGKGSGIVAFQPSNVVVKNGTVKKFYYGIYFGTGKKGVISKYNIFEDLNIINNKAIGLYVIGENTMIRNTSIRNTGGAGKSPEKNLPYGSSIALRLKGAAAKVENNNITGNYASHNGVSYGMYLNDSSGTEIRNNTIVGVGRSVGISIPDYTSMLISGNTITDVTRGIGKHRHSTDYINRSTEFKKGDAKLDGNIITEVKDTSRKKLGKRDGYRITWETYPNSPDRPTDMALSPDGSTLAVSSRFGHIRFFNVKTRELYAVFNDTDTEIRALVYSPDGRFIASAGSQAKIKIWDVKTGKKVKTLTGHTSTISTLTFSSDEKYLASGSQDRSIKLWNYHTGKLEYTFKTKYVKTTDSAEEISVYTIAFSPDGNLLAASVVGSVQLWQLSSKKLLHQFSGYFSGNPFSPDGKVISVKLHGKKGLTLYNIADASPLINLRERSGENKAMCFSPDGKMIATAGRNGIRLWDTESGSMMQSLSIRTGGLDAQKLLFTPDSKWLISSDLSDKVGGAHRNNKQVPFIRVWDVSSGKELYPDDLPSDYARAKYKKRLYKETGQLELSPDGKLLATNNKLWDSRTLEPITKIDGGNTQAVTFSDDSKLIAFGQRGPAIKILEDSKRRGVKSINHIGKVGLARVDKIKKLDISQDKRLLAVSYQYNVSKWNKNDAIRVINIKTGKILWDKIFSKEHAVKHCEITGINFTNNNDLYAVCSESGVFLYRFSATGKIPVPPVKLVDSNVTHWQSRTQVSFSSNSGLLAISYLLSNTRNLNIPNLYQRPPLLGGYKDIDGPSVYKIDIWDIRRKKLKFEMYDSFPNNYKGLLALALYSNGEKLVTGGPLSTIWFWDLKKQKKRFSLKHHAPRELSPIESLMISPDDKYLYSQAKYKYLETTGPRVFDLSTKKEINP